MINRFHIENKIILQKGLLLADAQGFFLAYPLSVFSCTYKTQQCNNNNNNNNVDFQQTHTERRERERQRGVKWCVWKIYFILKQLNIDSLNVYLMQILTFKFRLCFLSFLCEYTIFHMPFLNGSASPPIHIQWRT